MFPVVRSLFGEGRGGSATGRGRSVPASSAPLSIISGQQEQHSNHVTPFIQSILSRYLRKEKGNRSIPSIENPEISLKTFALPFYPINYFQRIIPPSTFETSKLTERAIIARNVSIRASRERR